MDATSNVPVPDPSVLTTAQLMKELEHVRELYDTRLDELNLRLQQRFDAQSKALDAAFLTAQSVSTALASKIDDLKDTSALGEGRYKGAGSLFAYSTTAISVIIALILLGLRVSGH